MSEFRLYRTFIPAIPRVDANVVQSTASAAAAASTVASVASETGVVSTKAADSGAATSCHLEATDSASIVLVYEGRATVPSSANQLESLSLETGSVWLLSAGKSLQINADPAQGVLLFRCSAGATAPSKL